MQPGSKLAYAIESAHGWCIGEYARSVARRRPETNAGVLPINTGRCICTNSGPFNFAVGLALGQPIATDEFSRVERFFRDRGIPPRIDITPYTHPSLGAMLRERRYTATEFTSILCFDLTHPLPDVTCPADLVLRWAEPSDCDIWVDTVIRCFFVTDPGPDRRENTTALFHAPNALNVVAELQGHVAGVAGGMFPDDRDVAVIYGSAVLPAYRNRGIHSAMLRFRLERLRELGCKLVAVSATPGSASEENLIRCGFSPCYEKITYTAPN